VIAAVRGEDRRRAGVPPRRLDRELDRIGARHAEEDTLAPVAGGELRQALGEPFARLVRKVEVMDELLRLLADRRQYLGASMAEVRDREAGEHVDVFLAVGVVDDRALAAHDRGWALEQPEADLPGRLVLDVPAQHLLRFRSERRALDALEQLLLRDVHRLTLRSDAVFEAALVHVRSLSRDQLIVS